MEIIELSQRMDRIDEAVKFFWEQWGSETNFKFYEDCIYHSCSSNVNLPKFYIALKEDNIIGSYALLRNELISRQDLFPWLACLYVVPEERGHRLGSLLLSHAVEYAKREGFPKLYLSTDLQGYYEKYDWHKHGDGYLFNGDRTTIFEKKVTGG